MSSATTKVVCLNRLESKSWAHCAKPAEFIVYGKLFNPEALGPRCYGCAIDGGVPHHALIPGNPQGYAVYHLPKLADERMEEAREELATVFGLMRLSRMLDDDYEVRLERVLDRIDRALQGEDYIAQWQELKDEVGDALGWEPPRAEALP
jgi:hypothetical protein